MISIKIMNGSKDATKLMSALCDNKFIYSLEFFQVDRYKVSYFSPSRSFLSRYEFLAFGKNVDDLISLANSKCKNILNFDKINDSFISVLDKTNCAEIYDYYKLRDDYKVFIISPISETSLVFPADTIGECPYRYFGFYNDSFTDDIIYPEVGLTNYEDCYDDSDDFRCDYMIDECSWNDSDGNKKNIRFVKTLRTFLDCKM